jgi:hypothetical protein
VEAATTMKALLDIFRRSKPIADAASLDEFIAGETAFIVQKTIWEYSRARSGVMWQKLFKEVGFKTAVEASCWRNYPIGLSFMCEMTAGAIRRSGGIDATIAVAGVRASARRIIASHRLPRDFEATFWADSEVYVIGRINRTLLAPPKAVKDIPLDGHRTFFEQMPIHPDLTRNDSRLLQNSLRIHLCRAHETLLSRLDAPSLAPVLAAEVDPASI